MPMKGIGRGKRGICDVMCKIAKETIAMVALSVVYSLTVTFMSVRRDFSPLNNNSVVIWLLNEDE